MSIRIFRRMKKEENIKNPGQQETEKQQIEKKENTDEPGAHHSAQDRPFSTHIEEIIKPEPKPDELLEKAIEIAITDGQISTTTLQRRLKIGYARAGRITDEMEKRGIISAKVEAKPQKCLFTRGEWERIKKETGL